MMLQMIYIHMILQFVLSQGVSLYYTDVVSRSHAELIIGRYRLFLARRAHASLSIPFIESNLMLALPAVLLRSK